MSYHQVVEYLTSIQAQDKTFVHAIHILLKDANVYITDRTLESQHMYTYGSNF